MTRPDPETWEARKAPISIGRFCARDDPHSPHRVEWAADGKAHLWDCPGVKMLSK